MHLNLIGLIIIAYVVMALFFTVAAWRPGWILFLLGCAGVYCASLAQPYSRGELIALYGDKLGSQIVWGYPVIVGMMLFCLLAGAAWVLTDSGRIRPDSSKKEENICPSTRNARV